jgi:hypothetical protein
VGASPWRFKSSFAHQISKLIGRLAGKLKNIKPTN